ncbi:MAG: hypothetical protein ACHQHO_07930 [Solirubrobacterales bacterium]
MNYANVVATLALVFAMSGGALAAKHYLLSSPKQISPKVLKSFANTNTALFKKLSKTVTVSKATTAGTAATATTATNASNATNATNATNASNATKATSATIATNATQLGGQAASAYALVAQPAFTTATLGAGFTNLGLGYSEGGYMKDTLGYVHLRGTLSCPAGEHTAFTLPEGFRPAANLFLPLAVGTTGAGNLQVLVNGEVKTFLPGSASACGLDGLTFKAEG